MNEDDIQRIMNDKPWMSLILYGGTEYLGVIQNVDDTITTIYDYGVLNTPEQKTVFMALAEDWWFTSNRLVPINVFLKEEWAFFRPTLKTLNSKDVEIKIGPHVSLKEIALKKSKRRSITLVRKMN
jgi:hypothetical protein